MRIKQVAIAVTVALAVLAASASGASRAHKYKSTITSASVSTANGYPNPGGTAVTVGKVSLSGYGEGALVDRLKITGHPEPNVVEFSGTEVDYLPLGTWKSAFTGKATVQPDGSQQIEVNGRFTGGTGIYKRSKGTYVYTGTVPPGSTIISGKSTGSITY